MILPRGWSQRESEQKTTLISPDRSAQFIVHDLAQFDATSSLPDIIDLYVASGELGVQEIEVIGDGILRRIGGQAAYAKSFEAGTLGITMQVTIVAVQRGEQRFVMASIVRSDLAEAYAPWLDAAFDDFEFTQLPPTSTPAATRTPMPTSTATSTDTPQATATPFVTSTPSPLPIDTPTSGPPTNTPTPAPTPLPAAPGVVTNFESFGTWRIGEQRWATLTQTNEQVQSGSFSGKIEYDFPASAGNQNFVVFLRDLAISGQPTALTAWVYGDGKGNFLNVWIRDNTGQSWQFTFGQIDHTGWLQMVAPLDVTAPWPNGKVGSDTGATRLTYPLTFTALVLDAPEAKDVVGAIYIDDLAGSTGGSVPPVSTPGGGGSAAAPTAAPAPTSAAAEQPTVASAPAPAFGRIAYGAWNSGANRSDVYVVNAATGNQVASYPNNSQPDIHPSGSPLVMNGTGGGKNNLMRYDSDGNDYPISLNPEDQRPNYAVNGERLIYTSTKQGDGRSRIYRQADYRNPEPAEPLYFGGREIFGDYAVYLDNWYIAYYGCDYWANNSNCGVYATFGNNDQPVKVTSRTSDHPTDNLGNRILFMTREQREDGQGANDNWDIYVVSVNGTGLQRLTDHPARDGLAVSSPNGSQIAFVSDRDGYWALYIMNADGSNQHFVSALANGFGGGEFDWTNERLSWGP